MSDDTKMIIVSALKKLSLKKPIEKITVSDITAESGLSRQTFYRQFEDKYALLNWYFDMILKESFNQMGEGKTLKECLDKKFKYIDEERVFFKEAFRLDDMNSLKEHDFRLIYEFYLNRIYEKTHEEVDDNIRFLLEMYCNGSVFMTSKWLMNDEENDIVDLLIEAMPLKLRELFEEIKLL